MDMDKLLNELIDKYGYNNIIDYNIECEWLKLSRSININEIIEYINKNYNKEVTYKQYSHITEIWIKKDYYEPIIKEIGCDKFHGFYESLFSNSDEFIDYEIEDKDQLINKYAMNEDIEVYYEYDKFDEYMKDVCDIFMDIYIDKILDILPSEILNDKQFIFNRINNNIEIISPKYYNYTTDKCYTQIKTNYYTLNLIKNYTLKLEGCKEYLIDNFTSCAGYISFITNNYNEWKETPIELYEDRKIIALMDMLIELDNKKNIWNIHYETYEDICKSNYTHVKIYNKQYGYTDMYEYIKDYVNKHTNLSLNKAFQFNDEAYYLW